MWNGNAMCEGIRAEERAIWLVQNQGLNVDAARIKVMGEFPSQFSSAGAWNPNANCDGLRAEERKLWLQTNQGMSEDAARAQVMREFPAQFQTVQAMAQPVPQMAMTQPQPQMAMAQPVPHAVAQPAMARPVQPMAQPLVVSHAPPMMQMGMPGTFGDQPVTMVCPNCRQQIMTRVTHDIGTGGWVWCLGWCCCTVGVAGCVGLLPCCIDAMKDANHACPKCNTAVGKKTFLM